MRNALLASLCYLVVSCSPKVRVLEGPSGQNRVVAEHAFSQKSSQAAKIKTPTDTAWPRNSTDTSPIQDMTAYNGHYEASLNFRCESNVP